MILASRAEIKIAFAAAVKLYPTFEVSDTRRKYTCHNLLLADSVCADLIHCNVLLISMLHVTLAHERRTAERTGFDD
eukprot:UN12253